MAEILDQYEDTSAPAEENSLETFARMDGPEAGEPKLTRRAAERNLVASALVTGDTEAVLDYKEQSRQYQLAGNHPTVKGLSESFLIQRNEELGSYAAALAGANISVDERIQMMTEFAAVQEQAPDVAAAFIEKLAELDLPDKPIDVEHNQRLLVNSAYNKIIKEDQLAFQNQINALASQKLTTDQLELGAELVTSVLAPGWAFKLGSIIAEVMPEEDLGLWDRLAPKQALKTFQERLRSMTPAQRRDFMPKLGLVLDEWTDTWIDNGFEYADLLQTLTNDGYLTDDAIADNIRWTNVIAFFDILPVVGTGAAVGIRGVKAANNGVGGIMRRVAPSRYRAMGEAGLDDITGTVADGMGTTRAGLVEDLLVPTLDGNTRTAGPTVRALDNPDANHVSGTLVDEADRIRLTNETLETVGETAEEAGGVLHLNKTEIETNDLGYAARSVIGATLDRGFTSLASAMRFAQGYVDELGEGAISFARVLDDGTIESFKPVLRNGEVVDETGEFFIQIDRAHLWDWDDVSGFNNVLKGGFNSDAFRWINNFLDKATQFAGSIVKSGSVYFDRTQAIKKGMLKTLEPYSQLNSGQKAKIWNVISEDAKVGQHWRTEKEVAHLLGNDEKAIRGYMAFAKHQEEAHMWNNIALKRRLNGDGFKSTNSPRFGQNLVSPVQDAGRAKSQYRGRQVIDEDTGEAITLTDELIDEMYAQGRQIVKTYHRVVDDAGGEWTAYIRNPKRSTLERLPDMPLRRTPSYVGRNYEATHVVVKLSPGKVDGVTEEGDAAWKTAYMAKGGKHAENKAAQLREQDPSGTYEVRLMREHKEGRLSDRTSDEYMRDTGKVVFSRRSPKEIESVDGTAVVGNINDALDQTRNLAARNGALQEWMEIMSKQWDAKYSRILGTTFTTQRIPKPLLEKDLPLWNEAIRVQDHILNVMGLHPKGALGRYYRGIKFSIGNALLGHRPGSLAFRMGEKVINNVDQTVLDGLRTLAFYKYIVLNPMRQILLQPQQISFYLGAEHGFKYGTSLRYFKELGALRASLRAIDTPDWDLVGGKIAKSLGITREELEVQVRAYQKSGIETSVDSHIYAAADVGETARGSGYTSLLPEPVQKGGAAFLHVMREGGFNFAERLNIQSAFLFARNKWIKNNPGKSWVDNVDTIAADARNLSFNMARSGALGSQRGLMGFLTQFMSHSLKAGQVLMPDIGPMAKVANKSFSNREKMRMALLQIGLYGTAGLGLDGVYDLYAEQTGHQMPQQLKRHVEEGVLGSAINIALNLTGAGEHNNVQFSKTFGPASGIYSGTPLKFVGEFVTGMIESQDFANSFGNALNELLAVDLERMAPGTGVLSDFAKLVDNVGIIAGKNVVDGVTLQLGLESKAELIIREVAKQIPFMSNIQKAWLGVAMGYHVDGLGNPTVKAQYGELIARLTFGLPSDHEREIQDAFFDGVGKKGVSSDSRRVKDSASAYYKKVRGWARMLDRGELTIERMNEMMDVHMYIEYIQHGQFQQAEFLNELARLTLNDPDAPLVESYYNRITKRVMESLGNVDQRLINTLKNQTPSEERDQTISFVESMFDVKEQNFNTEEE